MSLLGYFLIGSHFINQLLRSDLICKYVFPVNALCILAHNKISIQFHDCLCFSAQFLRKFSDAVQ